MRLLIILSIASVTLFLLSSCATASKTYTADGRVGYSISCSGEVLDWGACYKKAGEICGARGYDVLSKSGDRGFTISANQFGAYGGSVITRNIVVACKQQKTP